MVTHYLRCIEARCGVVYLKRSYCNRAFYTFRELLFVEEWDAVTCGNCWSIKNKEYREAKEQNSLKIGRKRKLSWEYR